MTNDRSGLAEGPADVTLASLLDALGGGLLALAVAPLGTGVTVSGPVIFDGDGAFGVEARDLLLAVGVQAESEAALHLVRRAGRSGAAAVVFRLASDMPAQLPKVAQDEGVALLTVPPTTSWGQLFTLVRSALEASRAATWSSDAGLAVGDLVQLANAIAGTVGGATTIEDPDSNVLAFSSLGHPIDAPRRDTILGHRIPGSWRQALEDNGVFKRLYGTEDVVRIGDDLGGSGEFLAPRMAIAVRAGGEVLGSVWVAQAERPFDDSAVEALRGAARIAALHMLHHRAAGDLERQRRGELIRALLSGLELPAPGIAALGLPSGTPLTVVAVAPDLSRTAEPEVAMARMVSVITLYAEVYRHRASAVAVDGVVYTLLPADRTDPSRLMAFAAELVARAQAAIRTSVTAGVGSTATELRDVHRSRQEADDVLRVLPRLQRGTTVGHVDDVRGHIALLHLEDLAVGEPLLRAGKLQRLVEHDRQHATCHIATLRAYLDWFGDVPAAAASLSIHRNTFRYRLGRLIEISGLDLGDADERLITHLQLRFLSEGDRG